MSTTTYDLIAKKVSLAHDNWFKASLKAKSHRTFDDKEAKLKQISESLWNQYLGMKSLASELGVIV